ncbi:GntR family transcriptional regulator [Roseovarius sp. MBR-78]|jgi:DNA-binding GntR family transcriptional regulator|uniref:GntR family transcriptional regulator n=1 Tax=Roseovarius sp. MBR-78 TaxID=3156460 RepID=UPI0033944CF7
MIKSPPNIPRYKEIVNELLEKVSVGDLKIGDRLAPETDLAKHYAVSRHTIRETMRCMQELGMIERRKGAGTYLISDQPKKDFSYSINTLEELLQYASNTKLEVLAVDSILADRDIADKMHCERGANWIRVSVLRIADQSAAAIGYSEIFIRPEHADVVKEIGTRAKAVYTLLEENYGLKIQQVDQDIDSALATSNVASRLLVPVGHPLLEITRRYYTDDARLIEASINFHPVGRFRYQIRLTRD